jgi:N-acetylmuramoyl-L-alanine amidase
MLGIFAKKRELRFKKNIHRGVYEDNLRITGKYSENKKSFYILKKIFLFFMLVAMIILVKWDNVDLTAFSENELKAKLLPQNLETDQIVTAGNPSEYRPLIQPKTVSISRMFGLGIKTIMIDPGHGGIDTGTTGKSGLKEKDITLDIAKKLRELLKKYPNYNVILTREDDTTLPLNKRVALAQKNKADLFISIHLNYLPTRPINMIETYYFGSSTDANALKVAEQENAGSQYTISEFKEIIEKISLTLKLQESKGLATSIQKSLFLNSRKQNENILNFGVKRAPFVVLLGVDVPAVLTEVSCISNKTEEKKLHTDTHRENIAHYIETGILDYLNKGEIRYEAKRR